MAKVELAKVELAKVEYDLDNFARPLLLSVPRGSGLVARKTGCPLSPNLIIINSATRSHSPPGLSSLVEYHFVSGQGPKNDQRPAGNLSAITDTSLELAIHSVSLSLFLHMMSLNIDMKIIRPLNCDGSLILVMNSWTLLMSCNVVNDGKYSTRIPSVLRRLCPMFCIETLNHSNCRCQTAFDIGFSFTFPRHNTESENT